MSSSLGIGEITPGIQAMLGRQFGHWTVVSFAERHVTKGGGVVYKVLCRCACGKEKVCNAGHVKSGRSQSCGCRRTEQLVERNTKHGDTGSREYRIWKGMIKRCSNKNDSAFARYGGRGITVCSRWLGDGGYQNFLRDMGRAPVPQSTIERIDNEAGYDPENCRWASRKVQARNKRNNFEITYDDRTQCLTAWAEELGIPWGCLHYRITRAKWSVKKAFTTPSRGHKNRRLRYDGRVRTLTEWAEELGMLPSTIRERLERGWTTAKALTAPVREKC